jgi:hypothetical protein
MDHSSRCALVAPSMQTHRSTFSVLAVAVEHIADPCWAADLDYRAEVVAAAGHRSPYLEAVVLVLLDRWVDRFGRQNPCSLVAAQAWEGHLQAFHEHRCYIVRADQAVSDFVKLAGGTVEGAEDLLH